MKKLFLLLLALMVCFGLFGCGEEKEEPKEEVVPQVTMPTIHVTNGADKLKYYTCKTKSYPQKPNYHVFIKKTSHKFRGK